MLSVTVLLSDQETFCLVTNFGRQSMVVARMRVAGRLIELQREALRRGEPIARGWGDVVLGSDNAAALAGLVSEQQVQTLPLNGRSIQNLVMLQPGMAQDNNGFMGWLAPQWIGNGNRGETEVATLDGSDSTDEQMGTIQF